MNVTLLITIGIFSLLFVVLFAVIMLVWKYIMFGFKVMFGKNILFVFIADKKNNLGWPHIADINEEIFTYKNKSYVYDKDSVKEGTILGYPYVIFSSEDTRTTAGIYWHNIEYDPKNQQFNPKYHKVTVKEGEIKKIPELLPMKSSVIMGTTFMRTVIMTEAFNLAISDFVNKNKIILYTLFGIGIGVAITAYFSFTLHSDLIPPIIEKLDLIIELLRTKE